MAWSSSIETQVTPAFRLPPEERPGREGVGSKGRCRIKLAGGCCRPSIHTGAGV